MSEVQQRRLVVGSSSVDAAQAETRSRDDPPFDSFVGGRRATYTVRGRTVSFVFSNDVWYAASQMRLNDSFADVGIRFNGLPAWLRHDAKRYVAHLWLECRQSAAGCNQNLEALRTLGRALGAFGLTSGDLTRQDGRRVAVWMEERARRGISILQQMHGRRRSEIADALRRADAAAPNTMNNYAATINRFARWLRANGASSTSDFEVQLNRQLTWTARDVGGAPVSKIITDDVLTRILMACDAELAAYEALIADREARGRVGYGLAVKGARTRAIYAQALTIQMLAARRGTATSLLPVDPIVEHDAVEFSDRVWPVIYVTFRVFKSSGEEGAPERVPFPGYFADRVLAAIETARRLTSQIRRTAPEDLQQMLFLGSRGKSGHATPLTGDLLEFYFKHKPAPKHGDRGGLVQRYGIEGAEHLTIHNARHTLSSEIVRQGGSTLHAAAYLGHEVSGGIDLMMKLFYLAGGAARQQDSRVQQIDVALGVTSTHEGDAVVQLPPNQRSPEQVLRALRAGEVEVVDDEWEDRTVEGLLRQGMVVQENAYGGCLLPAKSGGCITGAERPSGLEVDVLLSGLAADPRDALVPQTQEHLRGEIAMMRRKIALYEQRPEYAFLLQRERRQLSIWENRLARLDSFGATK